MNPGSIAPIIKRVAQWIGMVEIAAHAVAICGEYQRGKIRNGEGHRKDGKEFAERCPIDWIDFAPNYLVKGSSSSALNFGIQDVGFYYN